MVKHARPSPSLKGIQRSVSLFVFVIFFFKSLSGTSLSVDNNEYLKLGMGKHNAQDLSTSSTVTDPQVPLDVSNVGSKAVLLPK